MTYTIVFFGSRFIFLSASWILLLGPRVMNPPLVPSFLASLLGEAFTGSVEGGGPIGLLAAIDPTRSSVGSTVESLALGSACSLAISETLRPLGRGELSGVCSISLKARIEIIEEL